jgi:hypothetical protein
LTLSVAQFEAVRRHVSRRVVLPRHIQPAGECVVEIHTGFLVVEGDEARAAA